MKQRGKKLDSAAKSSPGSLAADCWDADAAFTAAALAFGIVRVPGVDAASVGRMVWLESERVERSSQSLSGSEQWHVHYRGGVYPWEVLLMLSCRHRWALYGCRR